MFNNNWSSIEHVRSLTLDKTKLVVLSKDSYVLFDLQQNQISKHFVKRKKNQAIPSVFDLSADDKFAIEVNSEFPTTVFLRNLVSNSIVAKFEGHS